MLQNENVSFYYKLEANHSSYTIHRNNQSFQKDSGSFKKEIDVTMVQAPK